MGKSHNRDDYFQKHIKPQPTPKGYIDALANSPYRFHRRMAVALAASFRDILKEQEQA